MHLAFVAINYSVAKNLLVCLSLLNRWEVVSLAITRVVTCDLLNPSSARFQS